MDVVVVILSVCCCKAVRDCSFKSKAKICSVAVLLLAKLIAIGRPIFPNPTNRVELTGAVEENDLDVFLSGFNCLLYF